MDDLDKELEGRHLSGHNKIFTEEKTLASPTQAATVAREWATKMSMEKNFNSKCFRVISDEALFCVGDDVPD